MSRRRETQYVFTPGAAFSGTIKVPGRVELNDILSIINSTRKVVMFSLGESAKGATVSYSQPTLGSDANFPFAMDGVTTITLDYNTTGFSSADKLIILLDSRDDVVRTKPFDYGLDAMERTRIGNPQSLIDADFEYGLQSSKWQNLGLNQNYPSFSDGSGPFVTTITGVTSNNATPYSTITVASSATLPTTLVAGAPVYIAGLGNELANGTFLVLTQTGTQFTYLAKGQVANSGLLTSNTIIREGVTYTGAELDVLNLTTNGTTTVTVNFNSPHNLIPGSPIVVYDSTAGTQAYEGNYFAETITSDTQIQYTVGSAITTSTITSAVVYAKTESFYNHRPLDGGVILSPYYPIVGLSAKRQTKRYFRYQSGKGMYFSTGTTFCPSFDLESASSSGTTIGSTITLVSNQIHGVQAGATVVVSGINTTGYNGTYTVASVVDNKTLTVTATVAPASITPTFSESPKLVVKNWVNAAVRAGMFDDTNGMWWEYDGQELAAVRRSSTQQLSGLLNVTSGSQTITGSSTRFSEQLSIGDYIQIRGQRYQVSSIDDNLTMSIAPEYRGATSTNPVPATKIVETRIPSSKFNGDKLDGTGPSGYQIDLTKMQMMTIQYTWYGAGFIDFMVRGVRGEHIIAHRIPNNNVNTEAFLRSGNLPARYEATSSNILKTSLASSLANTVTTGGTISVTDASRFPNTGSVLISTNVGGGVVEHEVISYTAKSGNNLTVGARATSYSAFINNRSYTFAGDATARTHAAGAAVRYMPVTCAPTISHWGSAVIMDGNFDEDKGFVFSVARTNITINAGSSVTALLFRPSPAVSNNLPGLVGERETINRSQTYLVSVEVNNTSSRNIEVAGVLNASNVSGASWSPAYNIGVGGNTQYQPTYAQVDVNPSTITVPPVGLPTNGELLFRGISYSGTTTFNLSDTKEIQNSIVGGNGTYPNGPEVLAIVITNNNTGGQAAVVDVVLKWKEAQA